MLRLALPVLAEQLLQSFVMLTDVWLTGQYLSTASALAAIGLIAYTMWFLLSLFDFVTVGATAMTARAVGAGDASLARSITNQSFLLGVILAFVAMLAGYCLARPFVAVMQLEDEAADLAVRFIWIVLPVLPAMMVQRVGIACLRGAGDMVSVFWVMAVVNTVNIGVSCALVTGVGPFPELGWEGIAIGTAAAHITGGLLVLVMLLRGRSGLTISRSLLRHDSALMRRVLSIGIPGGIDTLSIIACHMWFLSMINDLGDAAASAHGVAVRIESLAFLPGAAFALAAATLAGQYLGAGDERRAARSVVMACVAACGIMMAVGLIFFFAGLPLVRLFLDPTQDAIAQEAAFLLRIASYAMLPLALQMVLSGALRGAGDSRWPLVFTLVGFLAVRIPLTYWVIYETDLGVAGAWYAMLVDLGLRCLLVIYRFRHGGWKRIRV